MIYLRKDLYIPFQISIAIILKLVVEPTPLKNMLVKLVHFPKVRGENKKCLKFHHLVTGCLSFSSILTTSASQLLTPNQLSEKNLRFLRPCESHKLTLKRSQKYRLFQYLVSKNCRKNKWLRRLSKSFSKPKNLEAFFFVFSRATLPKTNSSALKIGHPKRKCVNV